jgi:5-methyltetrahydrofolate--homocysteine methyltransferase
METVVSSRSKAVTIGPDHPFVVIGERINPTGRAKLGAEMAQGNFDRVESEAVAQVDAGAQMIDVNAGIPLADEPAILAQAIQHVQQVTDTPLSIDSSVVAALQAGLEVYEGKALVNSVTGEEDRLESVLPLVKKHSAAVIGICNDEERISEDPDERFSIAKKIVERAEDHGIARQDVLIDPLAMPVGAVGTAGKTLFEVVRRCRSELGVNTVCGASNISFGLPNRVALNGTFLAMAIAIGVPCAITNPLEEEIRQTVLAANVLLGHDPNCKQWLASQRGSSSSGGAGVPRRRRRRSAGDRHKGDHV